jgi:hypothetical protein
VNETLDDTAIRRYPRAVWEFFRAVSGLVAIVALLGIVAGTSRLAAPAYRSPVVAPVAAGAQGDEANLHPPITSPSLPALQETMVFYLVSTPEQEYEADWAENVDAYDFSRHYRILYARDAEEYELAQQTILDHVQDQSGATLVQLNDLRAFR